MDDEVLILSLLREEKKMNERREAARRDRSCYKSTPKGFKGNPQPPCDDPVRRLYEEAGLPMPDDAPHFPYADTPADPHARSRTPPLPSGGDGRAATPCTGASPAEEIDRSDLHDEKPSANDAFVKSGEAFKRSVERLLSSVQATPPAPRDDCDGAGVERELCFAAEAAAERLQPPPQAPEGVSTPAPTPAPTAGALRTPRRNAACRQAELLRLFDCGTPERSVERTAMHQQFHRRYTLVEHGAGDDAACSISQLSAGGADGSSDDDDGDDAPTDQFSGDAAVTALVNICDGLLGRLGAARAARVPPREAMTRALADTEQLLAELEASLTYAPADPNARRPVGAAPEWVGRIDTARLEEARAAGGNLGDAAARVLRRAGRLLESPHADPFLAGLLEGASGVVRAAEKPLRGEWTGADEEEAAAAAGPPSQELDALRVEEEGLKAAGQLEACARLRVQRLQRLAEWLSSGGGEKATETRDTSAVLAGVRRAGAALEAAAGRHGQAATEAEAAAAEARAAVEECDASLETRTRAHEEEEVATRAALSENGRQTQETLDQIESLQLHLETLCRERCAVVKRRVVRVGEHVVRRRALQGRLSALHGAAEEAEGRVRCLAEASAVVDGALDVRAATAAACRQWEGRVWEADEVRRAAAAEATRQGWAAYEAECGEWCGVLESGVCAMEGRAALLRRAAAEAAERYDEGDRDRSLAEAARAEARMAELGGQLAERRAELVRVYAEVRGVLGAAGAPPPPPTVVGGGGAGCGDSSPEEPSPGTDDSPPDGGASVARRKRGEVAAVVPPPVVGRAALDAMRRVRVADAVDGLGRPAAQARAWCEKLEGTDVSTIADLHSVYSAPSVWRAFLAEMPLLKSELENILCRHAAAASQAALPPVF